MNVVSAAIFAAITFWFIKNSLNIPEAILTSHFATMPKKERWRALSPNTHDGTSAIAMQGLTIAGNMFQYRRKYGDFPRGENWEIANMLRGKTSPDHYVFLNWPQPSLGPNGEFLDPWKLPYKIEITDKSIKIISAGPNKTFGDKDDTILDEPFFSP